MTAPAGARLFGHAVRVRALGCLYLAGGAAGVLTLLLPHADSLEDVTLLAAALAVMALGVGVLARGVGLSEPALNTTVAAGTLLLAVANYAVAGTALYAIVLSSSILYVFVFLARDAALAHWVLIALTYTLALVMRDLPSPATRWVLAMGEPVAIGLLLSVLIERLDRASSRATDRARVLEESEARTRAIVDAAPDAFITVDAEGRLNSWNRAAERMFGISADDAIGRPAGEVLYATAEQRGASAGRQRRLLAELQDGSHVRYEVQMSRADGSSISVELSVSAVRVGGDRVLGAFLHDLTEREQRDREREGRIGEQSARRDAERMSNTVRGLQALLDAALAHRDLDSLLPALLPRVSEVVAADSVTIAMVDENGALRVEALIDSPDGVAFRVPPGESIAEIVAASREPLMLEDPAPAMAMDPALRGMSSALGLPLLRGRDLRGVICVGARAPRRFGEEDLALLGLAAYRVALALDSARVYEREHKIAVTLQRSLIPGTLPAVPGLEVAARYEPAAAEAEVGGDWYDVFLIGSGRVGLVIGDVAGKGLAAASMVGRLRSAMRAYALEGHDPPTAVERLNQLVWTETDEAPMATMLYAVVDGSADTLEWVSAGHLPPLVAAPDGARLLEGGRSVPLGVMPHAVYEQGTVELEPGSTVLLYTDGLVERPREVLDRGFGRLMAAADDAPRGPDALCDAVLSALVSEAGASDDVALLALHVPPVAARLDLTFPALATELAPMRVHLRRWLRRAGTAEDDAADILAAVGEAAANAVEHGGSADFGLRGAFDDGAVDLTVTDGGRWRDGPPSRDGGRGLGLMRALMDHVEVSTGSGGTVVRLRRRVATEGVRA